MLMFIYHHIVPCYFTRKFYVFLTCYLTAVKFEPQRNAILPRLRSDSDKSGQDRLRDAIEDHLCGICISMENLWRQRNEQKEFNFRAEIFRDKRCCMLHGAETLTSAEERDQSQLIEWWCFLVIGSNKLLKNACSLRGSGSFCLASLNINIILTSEGI